MQKLKSQYLLNRFLVGFLSIILFVSCSNQDIKYHYVVSGDSDIDRTIIDGKTKNQKEVGEWSIATPNGKLLANGLFDEGVKVGKWLYHLNDKDLYIDWKKYSNDKGVTANLPSNWTVLESDDDLLQATFKTFSKNKGNKYFIFGSYDATRLGLTMDEYNSASKENMHKKLIVKQQDDLILYNGNNKYYFTRYILTNNGENLVVFNLIGMVGENIIDIGFSSLDENRDYKHLLFFEIMSGLYYYECRLVDPFYKIKFSLASPSL